jgi:NAD(P)-dependent dehydrogenase (short-subunit alcohol dehydrogenase family)
MLKDYPPEEFESVLKTNVFGTYRVTWSLLPLLRAAAPGSVVVNMSSGVGRKGRAGWGGYAAGKFAVEGLTQVWADELRPEGVRVCALNPGATRSAMRAAAAPGEDPMSIPAPDAIVPALLWILSPEAQAQGLTGVSVDARDFVGWSG